MFSFSPTYDIIDMCHYTSRSYVDYPFWFAWLLYIPCAISENILWDTFTQNKEVPKSKEL